VDSWDQNAKLVLRDLESLAEKQKELLEKLTEINTEFQLLKQRVLWISSGAGLIVGALVSFLLNYLSKHS
jgi:hypothetical protein